MRDSYLKYWKSNVSFSFANGRGNHRYYAIITTERDKIKLEFRHFKKNLLCMTCGRMFYDTSDIPGHPPKKYMADFRARIVAECKYQFKRHGEEWDDSLIPQDIY